MRKIVLFFFYLIKKWSKYSNILKYYYHLNIIYIYTFNVENGWAA